MTSLQLNDPEVNSITLTEKDFDSNQLWAAAMSQVEILTKAGYVCTIEKRELEEDSKTCLLITYALHPRRNQYNPDTYYPYWLPLNVAANIRFDEDQMEENGLDEEEYES